MGDKEYKRVLVFESLKDLNEVCKKIHEHLKSKE